MAPVDSARLLFGTSCPGGSGSRSSRGKSGAESSYPLGAIAAAGGVLVRASRVGRGPSSAASVFELFDRLRVSARCGIFEFRR